MNGVIDVVLLAACAYGIAKSKRRWLRTTIWILLIVSGLGSVYDILFLVPWTDWTYVATATAWIAIGIYASFRLIIESRQVKA